MNNTKDVGFSIKGPEKSCENDVHCPFHGNLQIRGRFFTGKVISAKVSKNVTVEIVAKRYIAKYERYTPVRTRIKAHNPDCIKAKEGDIVRIAETRPISKTKNFVVVQIEKVN
jgi:small subunit ribosomal protein S17